MSLGLLTCVLAVALTTVWWPPTNSSAEQDGVRLTVSHELHLRPGIDSEVRAVLDRPQDGPATLLVDRDLLTDAGVSDVRPAPDAERTDGGRVALHWDDAPARHVVSFEGRVPTRQSPGRPRWTVATAVESSGAELAVTTRVWMLP